MLISINAYYVNLVQFNGNTETQCSLIDSRQVNSIQVNQILFKPYSSQNELIQVCLSQVAYIQFNSSSLKPILDNARELESI